MTQEYKTATIFGGTGFIGRQIVRELAAKGFRIKIATRIPEHGFFLKPCGAVGQVVPVACNYGDPASIAQAVQGSDYVVNCIGILFERGKRRKFTAIHADLPASIARACSSAGVTHLVHISALACDKGTSAYARSKKAGEDGVLKEFPGAFILRPSIVFGQGDGFFTKFARMSRFLPFLPLIGGGHTKFQPVYVGDVADAAISALTGQARPGIYELGGPEVLSFRQMYETLFTHTGNTRALIPLSFGLAKVKATFLNLMPQPLLTPDQVESLKTDNVVSAGMPGLKELGVNPTALSLILPGYLKAWHPGGRFAESRAA